MTDIDDIMINGLVFKGAGNDTKKDDSNRVKTKAKKLAYVHGSHGSGSAKMKEEYRKRRANRHKSKKA